jgi:hypothetical protein
MGWLDFSIKMNHSNGTTVEVNPCEEYHPRRRRFMEVSIEIPAGVLPRGEADRVAFIAKTLRQTADAVEYGGKLGCHSICRT